MPGVGFGHFAMPSVSLYTIVSVAMLAMAVIWVQNTIYEEQHLIKLQRESTANLENMKIETEHTVSSETKEVEMKDNINLENNTKLNDVVIPEMNVELAQNYSDEVEKNNQVEHTTIWTYPKVAEGEDKPSSSITVSVKRNKQPELITHIAKSILDGEFSLGYGVIWLMMVEPLCLVLSVNASYCALALIVQLIQSIVFGRLRPIERQHMKDKFWNLVFYKFIFVFGVMDVQSLNEALIWVSWFTVIAFLLLLTKLCKDRFEFLSFSPNTPMFYHSKVIGLLTFLLMCCAALAVISVTVIFPYPHPSDDSEKYDYHSVIFMLTECVVISVKTIHVMMRYAIHLYDIRYNELWERKATLVYHVDLVMELLSLSINFVHHLHMLFFGNIWLSMASLVICMQLRYIFSEIQKRLLRHKNYRRVVANMKAQFPEATREELEAHEDQCAICWDEMETARKLPCGHLFHSPCLRSWLEQDTSCPTCRKQLGILGGRRRNVENLVNAENLAENDGAAPNPAGGAVDPGPAPIPRRNFWHFDGSRIATWFPSFSVEVTHTHHGSQAMVTTRTAVGQNQVSNPQLDAMVIEVQEIFPQISAQVIRNDLMVSGSAEATTERILEGRNVVPSTQILHNLSSAPAPSHIGQPAARVVIRPFHSVTSGTLRRRHRTNLPDDNENVQVQSASGQGSSQSSSTASVNTAPSTSAQQVNSSSQSWGAAALSDQFAEAPQDRGSALQSRRESLLRNARSRYLEKQQIKQSERDSCAAPTGALSADEQRNSVDVPSTSAFSSGASLNDGVLLSGFWPNVTPTGGVLLTDGHVLTHHSDSEMSEESLG